MTVAGRRIHLSARARAAFSRNLRMWKNKFAGKRCFLVGNGVSLRQTPLEKIWGEYSFGLNRIAEIYPLTPWRPTFYVNVTVGITDEDWTESARKATEDTVSFIGFGELAYLLRDATDLEALGHVFPVEVTKTPEYSRDISRGVSKYGSSMFAVYQIATYMGFNPIYLVGCDCKWEPFDYEKNIDPNHFVDHYWGRMKLHGTEPVIVDRKMADRYTNDSLECHRLAKEACDDMGVDVYNATVGGNLDIFPRTTIEDVVAK